MTFPPNSAARRTQNAACTTQNVSLRLANPSTQALKHSSTHVPRHPAAPRRPTQNA